MKVPRALWMMALIAGPGCSGDGGGSDGSTNASEATETATSDAGSTSSEPTSTTAGTTTDASATTSIPTSDATSSSATTTAGPTGDPTGGATETDATSDTGDAVAECDAWPDHPEWIFCDDFESDAPLVGPGRYFEADMPRVEGAGFGGSAAVEAAWTQGQVGAGGLKVAFGEVPSNYFDTGIRPGEHLDEIYYRMLLRHEAGWQGAPAKLSRATVFVDESWSQAMIAHAWSGNTEPYLGMDPVRCVSGDTVVCSGYNDFANMSWLGFQLGDTPIFTDAYSDQWLCVEVRVKLNDPGAANGVQTIWIDGAEEVSSETLDFIGTYQGYGINAVFFENYWNDGAVKDEKRWFDNLVVSEAPIGCPG